MKKLICVLLACLMLSACGTTGQTPETTQPQETQYQAQQPTLSPTEPATDQEILSYRRDVVEAEMRRIMTTLWSPAEDITYYIKDVTLTEGNTTTSTDTPVYLYADRIYQGLPYTHASGSGYGFFSYASAQDDNGVYTLTGMDAVHLSGQAGSDEKGIARQGCDCADTLFWAWAQVSGTISFSFTGEMTERYGCIKVGDYVCDLPKLSSSTKTITKQNGEQTMYQAYAQLQKGDGLVLYTNKAGGHAAMTVLTHVEYDGDQIDGANSYVTIIEQKSEPQRAEEYYYNEEIGQNVYICGAADDVWTFETLYSKGYLPVTCKELVDPAPRPEESVTDLNSSPSIKNLWTGTLSSNYRIAYVTATISQNGKTVQQSTVYGRQKQQYEFSLLAFVDPIEAAVRQGTIDTSTLSPGTYRCTITCRLSTGNTHTVHDFEFSI